MVWVSERQRSSVTTDGSGNVTGGTDSIDIYARFFNSGGTPLGSEFLVNTTMDVCADPSVASASDGTFVIAWSQKDSVVLNNSWDAYARRFSAAGAGGTVQRLNTQRYGDQWSPKLASIGTDYLAVWTSMGQDGSREGVFGQFLQGDGSLVGGEFRVNTTVLNQQEFPAVSSDGTGTFLAVWSSLNSGINNLDLNAQRYSPYLAPLSAPAAPVVSPLDSYTLSVAWSPLLGLNVDHWELYVDTNATPVLTPNTYWQNEGIYNSLEGDYSFNPGETHSFQIAYVLGDGRHSPLSVVASGKTWGVDRFGGGANHLSPDGLPDDWQASIWGTNKANWLGPNAVLAPDGTTVWMVFQWGGNPLDPNTWLKTTISHNSQGWFLAWNTHQGSIYQVQSSTDLHSWSALGGPRFAAGSTDSVYLGLGNQAYYRITRLVY